MRRGDVLAVVMFAVAPFFPAMSTKLRGTGVRATLLIGGCAIVFGTAVLIAPFPISIGV